MGGHAEGHECQRRTRACRRTVRFGRRSPDHHPRTRAVVAVLPSVGPRWPGSQHDRFPRRAQLGSGGVVRTLGHTARSCIAQPAQPTRRRRHHRRGVRAPVAAAQPRSREESIGRAGGRCRRPTPSDATQDAPLQGRSEKASGRKEASRRDQTPPPTTNRPVTRHVERAQRDDTIRHGRDGRRRWRSGGDRSGGRSR